MIAAYRIHRMIQDLTADPQAAAAFRRDAEPVFERYGITEAERVLLRDGSSNALIALGVHPNLQMKYVHLRSSGGKPPGAGLLDAYMDRLTGKA